MPPFLGGRHRVSYYVRTSLVVPFGTHSLRERKNIIMWHEYRSNSSSICHDPAENVWYVQTYEPQYKPAPCPGCGRCPVCGHQPYYVTPPWPNYPQPYVGDVPGWYDSTTVISTTTSNPEDTKREEN